MGAKAATVLSETELDATEQPVRTAFSTFLAGAGLLNTSSTLLGLTFRTGGLHFAAKALELIPKELPVVIAGTGLSPEEMRYLSGTGCPIFNSDHRYDNELVYEMLMANTGGSFGWVDADCLVLNPAIWEALIAPMLSDVGSHTAFTYDPLGFAKSVLTVFGKSARDVLHSERTTLNSYALEPTNVGRAAPHAISRILQPHHLRYLKQTLGVGVDGELRPHDGFLDIFENGRTVNTKKRAQSKQWFGDAVRRTGWLIDTPMMAEVVLRANGFKTKRIIESNREITQDVIHVGASSYRERMRQEGANTTYLARFKLTDLFEALLADELVERGVTGRYAELSAVQRRRLHDEAGIREDEIKQTARSMLEEHGVDVGTLSKDSRFGFLL
jgi:hypothetical protein